MKLCLRTLGYAYTEESVLHSEMRVLSAIGWRTAYYSSPVVYIESALSILGNFVLRPQILQWLDVCTIKRCINIEISMQMQGSSVSLFLCWFHRSALETAVQRGRLLALLAYSFGLRLYELGGNIS